jgi:hypothetical protein
MINKEFEMEKAINRNIAVEARIARDLRILDSLNCDQEKQSDVFAFYPQNTRKNSIWWLVFIKSILIDAPKHYINELRP